MSRDMNGKLASSLGERLVVLLVIATIVIGALVTVPSLMAQTADTAIQMEERMHVYDVVQAEFESGS